MASLFLPCKNVAEIIVVVLNHKCDTKKRKRNREYRQKHPLELYYFSDMDSKNGKAPYVRCPPPKKISVGVISGPPQVALVRDKTL